jgi:aspartyl-tRNA(Asn)/glutamyl-tRNA(Gln) amidotransferase subunit C
MISKEEVQRIAKLARLELTEQEIEKMQKDLSSILDYMDILKKVKGGKEAVHAKNDAVNVVRKDEIGEKQPHLAGDLIEAAPQKQDMYIKVKAVL